MYARSHGMVDGLKRKEIRKSSLIIKIKEIIMNNSFINIKKIVFAFLCIAILNVNAQMVSKGEGGTFLLKNATVHTITKGNVVGDVLVKGSKIQQVGPNLTLPAGAKSIDCTGKHIYPGFIDGGTTLGLAEISSVSLTVDHDEVGDVIPHMKALTAVNPNAVAIPVTRTNGVTTVITQPTTGKFPGTSALIDLHGYTPDQMYAGFSAVRMNFPTTGRGGRWDRRTDEAIKTDSEKALKSIKDLWADLALYHQIDSAAIANKTKFNNYRPDLDALLPVYRGKGSLMIEVNKKEDIESALKWVKEAKVKAILTGVKEGWRVAKAIADAKVPVIVGPILDNPGRDYDSYDIVYANPSLMAKEGVLVAIRTDNSENVRNLPFHAAFAAAYGLGIDEAVKAITINPAKIFGLETSYGSVEAGKVANLIVCDGDPFEMKTKITHVFIKGWSVPMENRHTMLYDEFLSRSPGLQIKD
jgi:imidazolonepropionase-like amidohydrolase